jgi:hypothetical protein
MQEATTGCLRWLEHEGKKNAYRTSVSKFLENVHVVHRKGYGRITSRWTFRRQVVKMGGLQYLRIMSMMDIDISCRK